MIRFVPIAGIVLLAAGTCEKTDPDSSPSTAAQTAEQDGPQTGALGEMENVNEHLGELKDGVQKQSDDRANAIDEKIQRGTQ